MQKADGSVIINTRLNTDGFSTGAANLKSQFNSIGSSIKNLGGKIAAAFAAKVVIDFAKEAIKLGSDLQEVQNVVDVTFTTMNEQVNTFASNAAKTAGLSETMAKRYVGTFGAMAKSFGYTEEQAFSLSTTLTQLTGDVASFYNLSQDTAYTKLKSVFTGETESLKDLGVVMTQTALDDFALRKGLGKTTSQMTEQEKVAVRYAFVLDQLSSASGDFIRTQNGWANQTRLLTLQIDQLKATIGQGLINVLTPVIQLINILISKLQKFAEVFKQITIELFGDASQNDSSGGVANALGTAADNADQLESNIKAAGKAAKKATASFDEINVLRSKKNGSSGDSAYGSLDLNSLITPVNGSSVIDGGTKSFIENAVKNVMRFLQPLREIDFSPAKEALKTLGESIWRVGSVIGEYLEWAWFNILVPLSKWVIEKAAPELLDTLAVAFDFIGTTLDWCKPYFNWALENFLKPLANWTGGMIIDALRWIKDAFAGLAEWMRTDGAGLWDVFCREATAFLDFLRIFANDIISIINGTITGIVDAINWVLRAVNGIDIFGWKPFASTWQITAPQIPYLAKGAVIPPNNEFLAVLGDQKSGRNIEAPEGLIRDIFKEEMGDFLGGMMSGFEALLEENRNLRAIVESIEVGDTTIGQAANRYNDKMAVVRGRA